MYEDGVYSNRYQALTYDEADRPAFAPTFAFGCPAGARVRAR